MPMKTTQQCVQAEIKISRAKRAVQDAIDALREVKDIAKEAGDVYVGYDMDDLLYAARRLESDLGEQAAQFEKGPDIEESAS